MQKVTDVCVVRLQQKSPDNAKGSAWQRCMFDSVVRTNSKLTNPSNDVTFALARRRDQSCTAVLAKNHKFFLPPVIQRPRLGWPLLNLWKTFTDSKTRVLQAADGEDLVILACTDFD